MKHRTRKHAKPAIIIGFLYSKTCTHCNVMEPEWIIMKQMLKSYSKIKCEEIEAQELENKLPSLNEKYVVKPNKPVVANGYPTIFRIEDGKVQYYNGERTAVKMFNFATKHVKQGGESTGTVPPAVYGQQNTHLTMGGKSRRRHRRRHRRTQRAKSSWLSLW